jgi:hypothetical protein
MMLKDDGDSLTAWNLLMVSFNPKFPPLITFSNFSNWIVPGKVMLGRNPYVEQGRRSLTSTVGE